MNSSLSSLRALVLFGLVAASARAQEIVKLNPPLARTITASLRDPAPTPDGSELVYRADLEDDGEFRLYASPADGSGGARVLSPLGRDVTAFRIAPGGLRVVFLEARSDGIGRLWSVPLDGSAAPVELSVPSVQGSVQADFEISADGLRVGYRAEADGVSELHGVPIDRSSPARLLGGVLADGGDVVAFAFVPDGERLVFLADALTDETFELFVTGFDQAPARLSQPLPPGADVQAEPGRRFAVTAERAVWVADPSAPGRFELFARPLDLSTPRVRLHAALGAGQALADFALTADGTRAVLRADLDSPGLRELYSVPLDARAPPVRLNGPLLPGGGVENPSGAAYELAPDSTQVVFHARHEALAPLHLWSAALDGTAAALPLDAGLEVDAVTRARITPDSTQVVFTASGADGGLHAVPLAGGLPRLVGVPLPEGASATAFEPTATQVVFLAQAPEGTVELYTSALDGSSPARRLNRALAPGGVVAHFEPCAGGERVVYQADQDFPGVPELFGASLATPTLPWRINDPLPGEALPHVQVHGFALAPDGQRALFTAQAFDGPHYALFGVASDGSKPAVELSERPLAPTSFLDRFAFAPDGRTAVYVREEEGRVYAVEPEGTHAPRLLGTLPPSGGEPTVALVFSPDSRWLVYRERSLFFPFAVHQGPWAVPLDGSRAPLLLDASARQLEIDPRSVHLVYTDGTDTGLFRARLDGATPPVRLDRIRVAGGTVNELHLSADGRWVVYRAEEERRGLFELFAVPLEGGIAPRKLSGAFPRLGGVEGGFALAGREVVFAARRDGALALHAARLDGKGEPRKLANLAAWLGSLALTPQGRAIYLDARDEDFELGIFSVPIDGRAATVELSATLPPGRSTGIPQLSADGRRVVYTADRDTPEVPELHSVPADGSQAPLEISAPLPPGLRVGSFQLAGAQVVYLATDDRLHGRVFRVPLDGSAPAQEIGPPPNPRAILYRFLAAPDASRVLYLSDRDTDEIQELYSIVFPAERLRPGPGLPPSFAR